MNRFAALPGIAVVVRSPEGTILYANQTGLRVDGTGGGEEHLGRDLADCDPREWADEQIAPLRRVAETGERLLVRYIWEGKRLEAQYHRIPADEERDTRILVIVRENATDEVLNPEGHEAIRCDIANFGPLAARTSREPAVPARIGPRTSAKVVGDPRGCSHRSVKRHRGSMARTPGKSDRVQLACIAHSAGLELRDAHAKRVGGLAEPGMKPASVAEARPRGSPPGCDGRAARWSE
ncbi:MAG: PAS domain-containing protein [Phycisphaerales bacterium]|nr:PAS domain-containing protein [Phycisphaerales bacterium]